MGDALADLSALGVSVWLDDLSRTRLTSGSLERSRRGRHVVGVTTNPPIFAAALGSGDAYDADLRDLAIRGIGTEEAVRLLTAADVRGAAAVFRPVHEATGGVDGRVSIEVDPALHADPERTLAEAKALWWLIDRPNVYIKIPATVACLPAVTAAVAAGVDVNVTLIFSPDRYEAVAGAYLTGLEQALAAGRDLSGISSVASFFVSRLDIEVDRQLQRIGTPAAEALLGRASIANARLAHERYRAIHTSPRWQALAAHGARPQRLLWASTSMKNPAYPDVRYVEELALPGTVTTLPEFLLEAVHDHGRITAGPASQSYDDAHTVMAGIAELGIDCAAIVRDQESDGIADFHAGWVKLHDGVRDRLAALARR